MEKIKAITIADLDPLTPRYEVMQGGRCIGRKIEGYGHLKPQYGKDGRKNGGKWASYDSLKYKGTPPWFKYKVAEIKLGGYSVGLYVEEGTE